MSLVLIVVILPTTMILVPAKRRFGTGEFSLRRLAQETGGRLFTPKQGNELAGVYNEIANELTSQYVLGYLSTNRQQDGAFRRISVRVARPGVQARTRSGYYAQRLTRLQDQR